jgi:signal peptidase II
VLSSVLFLVLLDQLTKQYIVSTLNLGESIEVIKNFFYITSHENDGAAWGILGGQMIILIFITIISFALFYYLLKEIDFKEKLLYSIAVTLLISGAIGNFIDRVLAGYVVDFLDFIIFGYDFPTFNVADMALVIGVALFAFDILKEDIFHAKNKNRSTE